jgi:transcriptional regulator with XRE-family HTH domain
VRKPLGDKYISNPTTLGERIRNRRLELHLLQKDVAAQFGVSEDSITFWENNRFYPKQMHHKKITKFLGYNPFVLSTKDI